MPEPPGSEIWDPLLRAVDTEPREAQAIRGASGLSHPTVAVGVNETQRRLVVISAESDARSAALAQADIQSALPAVHVVVARPVAFDLARLAEGVEHSFGGLAIGPEQLALIDPEQQETVNRLLEPVLGPVIAQFVQAMGPMGIAAALAQGVAALSRIRAETNETIDPDSGAKTSSFRIDVSGLTDLDPQAEDRDLGVCPIPLFAFSEADFELLSSRADVDAVRGLLGQHNVLQYFFPAPDQLALGFIDRSPTSGDEVLTRLEAAPSLGHPFGAMELVPADTRLDEVVAALSDKGFVIEGEFVQELTPDGQTTRATVRFSPREGVVSKVLNRVNVNVDLSTRIFGG